MNKEQTSSIEGQNYAKTNAQRKYKDNMFRMLFKEKENLLGLYNALNQTAYTDVGNLEITTLENAVYMNYKNDISFVFDYELMLYEHQSTVNPNMPFRDLIYVTKVLQTITKDENLYGQTLVRLYAKELSFNEAVEKAVDYCIKNGILEDFLSKNRAEAIEVSIFEYDEEKHIKSEREWAYNNGLAEGKQLGLEQGEQRLIKLQQLLLNAGKNDDLTRAINDKAYREQLYKEYNL